MKCILSNSHYLQIGMFQLNSRFNRHRLMVQDNVTRSQLNIEMHCLMVLQNAMRMRFIDLPSADEITHFTTGMQADTSRMKSCLNDLFMTSRTSVQSIMPCLDHLTNRTTPFSTSPMEDVVDLNTPTHKHRWFQEHPFSQVM